jgi:hypothetical protein
MNNVEAYKLLAAELESWRRRPFAELRACIAAAPVATEFQVGPERLTIEIRAFWADETRRTIEIVATAYGPSTYRLERLEERVTVDPPAS